MQQRDGCAAAIAAANLRLMRNKTFRIVKRCPVSEFGTAESPAPSPGQGEGAISSRRSRAVMPHPSLLRERRSPPGLWVLSSSLA